MKNIFNILMLLAFISASACSGNSAKEQASESTTGAAAETAQQMAYICPMECAGSASHEPGKCPVCAMDLVKNPNYKGAAADSAAQKVN